VILAAVTSPRGISGEWLLGAVVGLVLLAGLVVILGRWTLLGREAQRPSRGDGDAARVGGTTSSGRERRRNQAQSAEADTTLVRSWIAISLVGGLLLFCAAAFGVDDPSLRSTLLGGLVASTSAAVAFYFASKAADQTRHDLLGAVAGTVSVPDLKNMRVEDAQKLIAATPLVLDIGDARSDQAITSQKPEPPSQVPLHTVISITAGP
jgi:hypothetical protein